MLSYQDVVDAAERIGPHIVRTPLSISEPMSARVGATVAIKAEHRQRTGSFKLRGALNNVFSLSAEASAAGVVTASSGNHGIGVATAAAARGIDCTVYLPSVASSAKVAVIERLGADIEMVADTDAVVAETTARETAARTGSTYVSPYNDPSVIAGQGTIGLEIAADAAAAGLDRIDAVVIAVGGGGLISGIATALATDLPEATIIGTSPANDQSMVAAAADRPAAPAKPTFSDGTAGAVEPGAITIDLCRDLVDQWMTIDETAIAGAVTDFVDDHHELVEGSAGVALAAAATYARTNPGAGIVVVTCGANVSAEAANRMLTEGLTARR